MFTTTTTDNLYIVKAFASAPFTGNPAAVCILPEFLPEYHLQRIARELNQPITSFVIPEEEYGHFQLRHFGPKCQVDICGHGTVAASHVIKEHLHYAGEAIYFKLAQFEVKVINHDNGYELEIPNFSYKPIAPISCVNELLCTSSKCMYKSLYDVIVEYPNEHAVRSLKPNFNHPLLNSIRAILATAPGEKSDYCYRVFAPSIGVEEDYFCGSANGALGPLWRNKLNKNELLGYSVSERGGPIPCSVNNSRVTILGNALTWFCGNISVNACA